MEKINLTEKLALFDERWSPKIIAELNGQHVKVAKLEGAFDWHHHAEEDELFLVVKGELVIEFRDAPDVTLWEGDMIVVPRGVDHRPVAESEVHVVLFEPASTRNTGNTTTERTVKRPDRI